jgi:hypothetical protein
LESIPGLLKSFKIPSLNLYNFKEPRNRFLEIDSWASYMFTNSGSADISLKHDVIVILLLGVSIMVQAIENVCCKAKIFGCFAFIQRTSSNTA